MVNLRYITTLKKENKQATLKENLKRLNQLPLTENPGQEKKLRHGCWTSKKYFQIYNYPSNMKVRMAIYNMKGKASIWWQDLKLAKGLKEKQLEWFDFKKYFNKHYLFERYYERKMKEFYELQRGQMMMEDLMNKFLELLRFVPYIREDKVKIHRFLSCLPQAYRDRIEFDSPKSLSKVFNKERMCYDQYKQRVVFPKV
jgi:hypothetical protein